MGLLAQKNDLVDWLCVAHYAEAQQLIESGITKDILVLGYALINHLQHSLDNNIHFMVDTLAYTTYLNELGKTYSQQINVHIKIDTGLSRLGIHPQETHLFIQQLKKLTHIKITGIFSHFVASDSNNEVTTKQFALFLQTVESLFNAGIYVENIHMSNTGSITKLAYPDFCTMFRVGLGVYGFSNNTTLPLQSTLTWKTYISAIKTIPAHSYVSYACTHKTTRITRIALLPVGYDDGYQLRFSNKTSVIINNAIAPVIGRVCMNITIVDITDCHAVLGDEVILIGSSSPVRLSDIAQAADIYNVREILTGINLSIQRLTI